MPSTAAPEPSPDFDALCIDLVKRWERGEIAHTDVLAKLKQLGLDAATEGQHANQGRAEHMSGYVQHFLGNYSISILHYEKARDLFQRVQNQRRVGIIELNQGENYRFRGDFRRARHLYHSAYETAKLHGDVRIQMAATLNEGLVLVQMKQFDAAHAALLQSYQLAKQMKPGDQNREEFLTELHYGLAQVELAQKNPVAAWEQANEALHWAQEADNILMIGLAHRILADSLSALPEPRPADPEAFFRTALKAFREIEAEAETARTLHHYARSLLAQSRRRPALQLYQEASTLFDKLGMTADAAIAAEEQLNLL